MNRRRNRYYKEKQNFLRQQSTGKTNKSHVEAFRVDDSKPIFSYTPPKSLRVKKTSVILLGLAVIGFVLAYLIFFFVN